MMSDRVMVIQMVTGARVGATGMRARRGGGTAAVELRETRTVNTSREEGSSSAISSFGGA